VTQDQERLYGVVTRNMWIFRVLEGHTGGPFIFWVGLKTYAVSENDVRYVLARLVLGGVKVNASLDA
jgi:hypothetical protein